MPGTTQQIEVTKFRPIACLARRGLGALAPYDARHEPVRIGFRSIVGLAERQIDCPVDQPDELALSKIVKAARRALGVVTTDPEAESVRQLLGEILEHAADPADGLSYEAALEIALATDHGDFIEEYEFDDELGHLFLLDDASTLVVSHDGLVRREGAEPLDRLAQLARYSRKALELAPTGERVNLLQFTLERLVEQVDEALNETTFFPI